MSDITQAQLEARIGAAAVGRLFDDDGDGVADDALVKAVLDDATGYARGQLLKAFRPDQIDALKADPLYVAAICDVAIGIAGERRAEWLNDQGKGLYDARLQRGRETLKNIAAAKERLGKESTVGQNALVGGTVTHPTPTFVFAPTKGSPQGRGGY